MHALPRVELFPDLFGSHCRLVVPHDGLLDAGRRSRAAERASREPEAPGRLRRHEKTWTETRKDME
jgi:hypothetical protein